MLAFSSKSSWEGMESVGTKGEKVPEKKMRARMLIMKRYLTEYLGGLRNSGSE